MLALKGKSTIGDDINKKIIAPLANANKLSDFPDFNDPSKWAMAKRNWIASLICRRFSQEHILASSYISSILLLKCSTHNQHSEKLYDKESITLLLKQRRWLAQLTLPFLQPRQLQMLLYQVECARRLRCSRTSCVQVHRARHQSSPKEP
jgi:hypothetical protein